MNSRLSSILKELTKNKQLLEPLTPKEVEVLGLFLEHESRQAIGTVKTRGMISEIAKVMGDIDQGTVRRHRASIYKKLKIERHRGQQNQYTRLMKLIKEVEKTLDAEEALNSVISFDDFHQLVIRELTKTSGGMLIGIHSHPAYSLIGDIISVLAESHDFHIIELDMYDGFIESRSIEESKKRFGLFLRWVYRNLVHEAGKLDLLEASHNRKDHEVYNSKWEESFGSSQKKLEYFFEEVFLSKIDKKILFVIPNYEAFSEDFKLGHNFSMLLTSFITKRNIEMSRQGSPYGWGNFRVLVLYHGTFEEKKNKEEDSLQEMVCSPFEGKVMNISTFNVDTGAQEIMIRRDAQKEYLR